MVIESTVPLSSDASYADWHQGLEELGYKFVYFEELNRFYVSLDHPELEARFGPGPNLFDNFTLSGKASAPFTAKLNTVIAELQVEKRTINSKLVALETQNAALTAKLDRSKLKAQRWGQKWKRTEPKTRIFGYELAAVHDRQPGASRARHVH